MENNEEILINKSEKKNAFVDQEIVEKIILVRKIILIQIRWRVYISKKKKIRSFFERLYKFLKLDYLIKKFIRLIKMNYFNKALRIQIYGFSIFNGVFYLNNYKNIIERENFLYFAFDDNSKIYFNVDNYIKNINSDKDSFNDSNFDIKKKNIIKNNRTCSIISDSNCFSFLTKKRGNDHNIKHVLLIQKSIKGYLLRNRIKINNQLIHNNYLINKFKISNFDKDKNSKIYERNVLQKNEFKNVKDDNFHFNNSLNSNKILNQIKNIQKYLKGYLIRKKQSKLKKAIEIKDFIQSDAPKLYDDFNDSDSNSNKILMNLVNSKRQINLIKEKKKFSENESGFKNETDYIKNKQKYKNFNDFLDIKKIIKIQRFIRKFLALKHFQIERSSCGCACLIF